MKPNASVRDVLQGILQNYNSYVPDVYTNDGKNSVTPLAAKFYIHWWCKYINRAVMRNKIKGE